MRKGIIILSCLIFIFKSSIIHGQLDTNAPWPMFRQNIRHTGQTNQEVLGVQKNPIVKWSYMIGEFSSSSPAIGPDGTVYVGSVENKLYAITNGALKWAYNTGGYVDSSPAIDSDGAIYIGSDCNLYAITNGALKWSFGTEASIESSSPAIDSDGTIYIGNNSGNLYAITNGSLKWSYNTGNCIRSSPAIGFDGTIYVGCDDGKLYAVTNGYLKWSYHTETEIRSSPAIDSDGAIYIGSGCNLYAITNGALKWSYNTGSWVESSPAIGSDGTVYVGNGNGNLYAINNDGSLKWSYNTGGNISSSPAIGSDNTIYIGSSYGELYAITNGALKWSYNTSGYISSSPAIGNDGAIYICDSGTGKLYAISQNEKPELAWTDNPGYLTNGVNPDSGNKGDFFRFEVKYMDKNNDYPSVTEVWIDTNNNDVYDASEKFTMSSISGSSYSNGIIYTNLIQISYPGDLKYRFYFTDKYGYTPSSTNAPFTNHLVCISNQIPELAWTEETGYLNDGVSPNTNIDNLTWDGGFFQFRVKYSDQDNLPPKIQQLWLDRDDNGSYEANEKITLFFNSGSSYSNGIIYTNNLPVEYAGDGTLNYRFYFRDSGDDAVGMPTNNRTLCVVSFSTLTWLGFGAWLSDGVDPDISSAGSSFEFRIRYFGSSKAVLLTNHLWLDLNDNNVYENNEKIVMDEVDSNDLEFKDGKDYKKVLILSNAGDGYLKYKFYFRTKDSIAAGKPVEDRYVQVIGQGNSTISQSLAWVNNYNNGVNTRICKNEDNVTFHVNYINSHNQFPSVKKIYLDINDNGEYENAEKIAMSEYDPTDTSTSDGKVYTKIIKINFAGDGKLNYKFCFSNGDSEATGEPTETQILKVTLTEKNLDKVIAGPLPFKKSESDLFLFQKLTKNCVIKIYTTQGELVKTLYEQDGDGKTEWDLKNRIGNIIAQGMYLCEITNEAGEKTFIKIIIVE